MLLKWWKPLPKEQKIEDMLQIVGILPNGDKDTFILKSGHLAVVYEILGKDYTGLDDNQIIQLHSIRNEAFKHLPSNVIATIHSKRIRETIEDSYAFSDVKVAKEINEKWNKKFQHSFKNRHYLVLTTTNSSMINELALLHSNKEDKGFRAKSILEETSRDIKNRLREYRAIRLQGDSLISFISSYLNGKEVHQKYSDIFGNLLGGCDLVFDREKNYHSFDGNKQIFSAWIGIKSYEDNTTQKMIDELMKFQFEFSLYCQFQNLTSEKALFILDDKHRTAQSWLRYSEDNEIEFNEIIQRIQNKEVSLAFTGFAIQIKAKNLIELEANIEEISTLVDFYGFRTIREKTNIEPLFWSLTAGLEHLMVRKRYLTSENISDLANFSTVGEGLERCSWGNNYVTQFLTSSNTIYRFCFHNSENDKALGHTLIFGASNSGKTTLINFLMSQALRFEKLRIISFDRLQGQKIFTLTHGGNYTTFSDDNGFLNPFSLPGTRENKTFLSSLISDMAELEENNHNIDTAIDLIYSRLTKESERNLDSGITAFAPMSDKEVALDKLLLPFTKKGKWGNYLNAKKDSLDFEASRITTFDMDTLISEPKLLGIILNYIFYRIKLLALPKDGEEPKPHLIFADELPNLLESDIFAKRVKETVLEHRKLDGVFIGASQTPQALTNHSIGKSILGSFANFIFYPDPLADRDTLSKDFQLNDNEINWIKNSGENRKILFKRNGGESVILNVDLITLEEHLKCFNSSNTEKIRLENLIKSNPNNWIKEFLK